MPDCELLTTCPFFNDKAPDVSGMTEMDKEQYCKGDFGWCGRYLAFKAREKESERITHLNPIRKLRTVEPTRCPQCGGRMTRYTSDLGGTWAMCLDCGAQIPMASGYQEVKKGAATL